MENEFVEIMSKKTDEQLIKIVTVDKDDYVPLALLAANEEINRRQVDVDKIRELEVTYTEQRERDNEIQSQKVDWTIRLLNLIIDDFTVWVIIVTFNLLLSVLFIGNHASIEFIIILLDIPAIFIGYYVFFEFKYQKTLGKLITKSKVVTDKNERPDLGSIVTRSLSRFIPCNGIYFLFTQNGLHDKLSATIVVSDRK